MKAGHFIRLRGKMDKFPFIVLLFSIYVLYVETISCYMSYYLVEERKSSGFSLSIAFSMKNFFFSCKD